MLKPHLPNYYIRFLFQLCLLVWHLFDSYFATTLIRPHSFSLFHTWFKKFSIASFGKNGVKDKLGRVRKETFIAVVTYDLRIFVKALEIRVYFEPRFSVPNRYAVTPLKLLPVGFHPVTSRRFGISEVVAWGQNLSHWIEFVPRCKPESKQNVIKCNVIERKTSVCVRMLRHLVSKAVLSKRLNTIAWRYEF